jgi:thiol-disulfide isomerase/thioredoxin
MSPATRARLTAGLTIAALLLTLGTARAAGGEQTLTPLEGTPQAPDFDLQDPEGNPQRLADYKGKPVILNFWATWCPPCREEMPSMQRAHEAVAPEGIALVAINVGEDADTIEQFLASYPVDFPLPMDLDSKVVQSYPVKGLPTTFVLDPEGRLVYIATGGREWDDPGLLDQVRALRKP